MNQKYEIAARLYHVAVEEFQGLVCRDAETGPGPYEVIVTKHAEVLQHRAERIAQEMDVPVRVLHAFEILRIHG